jgi:hypothetical protein
MLRDEFGKKWMADILAEFIWTVSGEKYKTWRGGLMFRKNISPPSSGSTSKPCKNPQWKQAQLSACFCQFLAWLMFRPWRWRRYVPPKCWAVSEPQDVTTQKTAIFIITVVRTTNLKNKKFWEELIAYFPWYDTGHIENDASNNSSIVACVFVTAVTFLPSRRLATIGGFLPSSCLAKIRVLLPSRCLATIGGDTQTARWSHKPTFICSE